MRSFESRDPLGAFVPGTDVSLKPQAPGPLNGMTFAAKDIFDIAGEKTGCGNPDWRASHPAAEKHAWAVEQLLNAGARLVGKTITDELAYSLNGQNHHYGTPTNSNAPGRIPGGSSSGSAAAVAGGLCDTALGSDTGGSIRIPGSYCGLFGLRPTHDRIPLEGVMPLAPSYDTVGWFARDAETLKAVGEVLLGEDTAAVPFERLLLAEDAMGLALTLAQDSLSPWVKRLEMRLGKAEGLRLMDSFGTPEDLMLAFRAIQAREIWAVHGDWIADQNPTFGAEVQERFDWVQTITEEEERAAQKLRADFTAHLESLMTPGTLMVLPSAPGIAPLVIADASDLRDHRSRVLALTCISGLSGLPQVTLPLASLDGCPLGLSLLAPRGSDRALLDFVAAFCNQLDDSAS
ncbi:amidase [Rhodovibrionaceae bacterium A322]